MELKEKNEVKAMKGSNKKGFTLLELIVVIAILGMVITTITGLMFYGFNVYTLTSKDFEVQSDVRLAMEETDKLVRYSSALFAVPDVTYMDAEWNYIGMNAAGTEIINYRWDAATQTHIQEVMVGPYDGITFNIGFEKANNLSKDNTLRMYFESFTANGSVKRYDIKSGYEALNSLQVINYGTASNPAKALAYREEQYSYENFKLVVNITMVLDVSGSMGSGLVDPNGTVNTNNPSRISVLKTQSKMIVEKFAQNSNSDVSINLSLVPFSTYAKTPSIFYDVKNTTQKSTLLSTIDAISANGNTNTGDGLRRSYYQLLTKQTNDLATATTDTIVKNYTIILVDGESNHSSMYNTSTTTQVCTKYNKQNVCTKWANSTTWEQHYYSANGTINNCTFTSSSTSCTPGYVSSITQANEYVDLMGANVSNPDFVTNYLVSFATDVSATQITFIADATQTPSQRVYYATDANQLGLSFTEIQMSITNDLWQFLGPKLSPTAS
jgi:prepilin-type N-terminal cleavage/methylation domain-containing protein